MTVAITNSNNSPNALPLVISSLQIAGLNATDFTIATGCNLPNYPSGQSCNVGIVFTPGAPGNRVATLVVNDNTANSPQIIALNGSTQAEVLTVAPASPGEGYTQSVNAGQTATFSLTITPIFTGSVSFSPCSGAPTTSTCTVSPSQLPVFANEPAKITVAITTTSASSSTMSPDIPAVRPFLPVPIAQIYAGILCSTFLLLFLRSDQRRSYTFFASTRSTNGVKIPAPIAGMAATALLTMTLLTLAGCGGASTVATAPTAVSPSASSQTYTISITPSVTASDAPVPSTLQPIQLTLIVN
jgi:hypothetical protein